MPSFETSTQAPAAVHADVMAMFVASADDTPVLGADVEAFAGALQIDLGATLDVLRFDGSVGSVARVPCGDRAAAALLLLIGVGPRERVDTQVLRRAAGRAVRNATKNAVLAVAVPGDLGGDLSDEVRAGAIIEGAGLGAYAYTAYRSKNTDVPSLERIVVVPSEGVDPAVIERAQEQASAVVDATNVTRDLVNTPPAAKRPPELASRITELAEEAGLQTRVLDEAALTEGAFGGLLGVGRGSVASPRLVELSHAGSGDGPHVVLVGKGITFDSGGLSLKPSNAMSTMKTDMSGAAAVVGAMLAAARLQLRPRITGLLALAENMPSGDATRVSDVLTHRNGTTVEVMNTDAEGRLVLADALLYGQELKPDVMIDLATLTGGQVVALGRRISALMGTDDRLLDALEAAAAAAGEGLWRLPLPEEYREHLKSEVADLKNIGRPREAQSIVAGLFLKEFTGEVPWAHMDIAGPAFDEHGDGTIIPRGATGVGVRTLVHYLRRQAPSA